MFAVHWNRSSIILEWSNFPSELFNHNFSQIITHEASNNMYRWLSKITNNLSDVKHKDHQDYDIGGDLRSIFKLSCSSVMSQPFQQLKKYIKMHIFGTDKWQYWSFRRFKNLYRNNQKKISFDNFKMHVVGNSDVLGGGGSKKSGRTLTTEKLDKIMKFNLFWVPFSSKIVVLALLWLNR